MPRLLLAEGRHLEITIYFTMLSLIDYEIILFYYDTFQILFCQTVGKKTVHCACSGIKLKYCGGEYRLVSLHLLRLVQYHFSCIK